MIHTAAQAMSRGETINTFIDAVYNYPSLTDLYKYAAYDGLGKLQPWFQNNIAESKLTGGWPTEYLPALNLTGNGLSPALN
ncbi:MAG: hypothetical protein ABI416_10200 [Ginsengibacter sp.]